MGMGSQIYCYTHICCKIYIYIYTLSTGLHESIYMYNICINVQHVGSWFREDSIRGTFRDNRMLKQMRLELSSGGSQQKSHGCGSKPMVQLGVGAPPILAYFSGDRDVHWGHGILTHRHIFFISSEQTPMGACLIVASTPGRSCRLWSLTSICQLAITYALEGLPLVGSPFWLPCEAGEYSA